MKSISPVRVFLSSLCVSTALCSVIPAAWGMDDDNKDHFFLTLNKEKQEHQDHKENQEKNRKKSFHKLTGRSLTIELLGEETRFYEEEVPYDGDCGYSALNISRQAATELLLQNIHGEDIQTLIAPEIYDMLPLLPESHPVLQLQAYQRLAQQDDLDRPYQEQVTSLNDLLNRTKEDGRDGDQLWGYCQQNLNSIQQNPLQNQSYLTFKSLREKIKQNEEERMQFCSQKETIECYIKNFMQIPVHTYFNQYEDNNWLNYSPILMQNQKHRTHAINAIAQLLGKNLIIFDEEGNIKHHYSSSEAPMGKDNTLLLRHIGNHHFNRLIFLEKNEEVEYLDFLRPKPILKEEIQDNSHEKGAQLFPSPILDFINCPVILDEGMKDLQKRLINIGNNYNKLTSLKKALLQWINTPEKGENQNQIKEQLKKLIPLLLPPEELVITSEKGSLGMILEAFYHSKRKTEKDVVIHSAFGAINDRIERCENFASRVEIYSKENSLVLREIKAIYEMYRQGFLLFNIQDEYSLRLMSKDPSLEEMKKIEPGELGIFCKDGGLYCKTTEQENILQIIKSDDPKVGLHPDIFEKFLSVSQKIDSNDKKALLQYTLLKGYTLQDLENEYKKYLASKAELYGTLLSSPSLIQQSIAYQLVSRTLFNKVDKQNKEGTHAVRSFEGMHFKVYDYDSELGLCPGKELAMYHLYQLLIGEGVAPSTLVCIGELPFVDLEKAGIKKQVNQALSEGKDIGDLILENPNILHQIEGNKTKALYPIQVSATIEGMGFHTFLENHFFAEWKKKNLNQDPKAYLLEDHGGNSFRLGFQHRFAEFIIPKTIKDKGSKNIKEQKWNNFLQTFNSNDWSLDHIDEESFARMALMSFLTDPGDSKADNFMIYRKSKKEKNQKWHIISIDTDRVFEPNLHEIESGTKKGHHKVHHKSLFYTLPFFMKEKSLSQKIKNEFKAMNVPLILAKWLLTLRDGNKAYAALQQESALPEKVYTSMKLPVTFKKGQVLTLLRRLQDLQNIVTHHDFNLTLDRTFELMHPVLYAYYEKLYHLYSDDPLARIYEDNARENNQELTVESVLKEEGLSQKDEEGRSFKDLLQEFNEIEGNTQNSKTLDKNHQTIDEALDEFSQQI
ncbi:MAG: hypothetical protein KBD36_06770, partial [Alphaproteobacteria bacterium]|nr:hypothetical protein [Alphaproteobacteria bacterium]